MANTERQIGTIWKEEPRYSSKHGQWKIQMPRGIQTTTTQVEARMWSTHVLWELARKLAPSDDKRWAQGGGRMYYANEDDPHTRELRDSYLKAKADFDTHQTKVYNKRRGLS